MIVLAAVAGALLTQPPDYPVVITTDKAAYVGKDSIVVSLENRHDEAIWIQPWLSVERSNGDDTWAAVYKILAVSKCPPVPPRKQECIRLDARSKSALAPWDWNTGGTDQCPPRRPGHRAFKGVHRIVAQWCEGKAPKNSAPRVKLVTWE